LGNIYKKNNLETIFFFCFDHMQYSRKTKTKKPFEVKNTEATKEKANF